jgi:hypothetical protein
MKNYFYLPIFVLLCGSQFACAQSKSGINEKASKPVIELSKYECLPEEIKPETVVSVIRKTSNLRGKVEFETVRQRLGKLNARCKAGKLVGGNNKEIRFYQLQGCWGNPPPDYTEILNRQRKELEELKKRYAVIEITCNSSGEMPF